MTDHNSRSNNLINEKSPYLLQHAHNPVDWYPWGEVAFERARSEDKPIFLSIGYSTCHWCHVMEKESFEDHQIAELMNEAFVNIKVDREERPDIDSIYMHVCQLMTGSGGWPLTIIMTPEKKPFFAATYIPRETRLGRTGMRELIPQIKQVWENQRDDIDNAVERILSSLQETEYGEGTIDRDMLDYAYLKLSDSFDEQYGGFRRAPKFPSPHIILFLIRYWNRTGVKNALKMMEKTLTQMRLGGIFDQLGYGFHRYSTDSKWIVPHFEKMLYDQAMLSMAYTEAYQVTKDEHFHRTVKEVLDYVLRDMTSPQGGFYSAEDADSEGEEGKFYVWTEDELKQHVDDDLVLKVFNVHKDGNFREDVSGSKTGRNILYLRKPVAELASDLKVPQEELEARIQRVRHKLLQVREKRVHPLKDDKILTDWNGLMIAALARASSALNNPEYGQAAERGVEFILNNLTMDGEILHRYRDGEAAINGFVDDYSFFIWGLIELYEATFKPEYLKKAVELSKKMVEKFYDEQKGGFYLTSGFGSGFGSDFGEQIVRKKEIYDGAYPSGNSVAILDLLRLARMTENTEFEDIASRSMESVAGKASITPEAFIQFLVAVDFAIGPTNEVVISGDPQNEDTGVMLDALRQEFIPRTVVLFKYGEELDDISGFTSNLTGKEGRATAYVCRDHRCNLPTTDPEKMMEFLEPDYG
ncbi:MAG: thioredoxin domain-containing protein [Archaeoglobaceae archaeon]